MAGTENLSAADRRILESIQQMQQSQPANQTANLTDLDGDTVDLAVTFKLGGKIFSCFPVDELDWIHGEIVARTEKTGEDHKSGNRFDEILADRLQIKHGVTAPTAKAYHWYQSLCESLEKQQSFSEGLAVTSDSTVPAHSDGDSQGKNSNSSKRPSKRSGAKN